MQIEITPDRFPLAETYITLLKEAQQSIFKNRMSKSMYSDDTGLHLERNAGRNYNHHYLWSYKIIFISKDRDIHYSILLERKRYYVQNYNGDFPVDQKVVYKIMNTLYKEIQEFKRIEQLKKEKRAATRKVKKI